MSADVLIVGQGLAGTLLGWELERAGISFRIVDAADDTAASRVAAGIVNPITGQRIVKSWRVDTLWPLAQETYRAVETAIGGRVWHELRVRRLFANDRERQVFVAKRGELAPFVGDADADGFWIEPAARVDLAGLIDGLRRRWRADGVWSAARVDPIAELERYALVLDCRGIEAAMAAPFAFVPWEFSKGEVLEIGVDGLDARTVLNRGHWVMPSEPGRAWVGATHEPGIRDRHPTERARRALCGAAEELLRRPFVVHAQRAGIRVNLPDKHPVAGRHPREARLGIVSGLGAKGVLLAPWLARQWLEHLRAGAAFDPAIEVARFWRTAAVEA